MRTLMLGKSFTNVNLILGTIFTIQMFIPFNTLYELPNIFQILEQDFFYFHNYFYEI